MKTLYFPETSLKELAVQINQFFNVEVSDKTVNKCYHQCAFKYGSRVISHPPKVIICGAIGFNFKSNLVIFTKSVNPQVYIY